MDKYPIKSFDERLGVVELGLTYVEDTTSALFVSAENLLEDVERKVRYGLPPVERSLGIPSN